MLSYLGSTDGLEGEQKATDSDMRFDGERTGLLAAALLIAAAMSFTAPRAAVARSEDLGTPDQSAPGAAALLL